jgi:hypothetical protein
MTRNFIKQEVGIRKGRKILGLRTACEPIRFEHMLAKSTIVASLTLILTNPAVFTLWVKAYKPPIECLVQIIQVLRVAVVTALWAARITLSQSLSSILTVCLGGSEPAIVVSNSFDRIIVRGIELFAKKHGARFHVFRDVFGALAIGVVLTSDLHEPWCATICAIKVSLSFTKGQIKSLTGICIA